MQNYLSYGGGVNSTAMLLLLLDEGWEFEAVYVDHGCDWPETRKYVAWLSKQMPITTIRPMVEGFSTVYDYFWHYKMVPSRTLRICTDKFKIRPLHRYFQRPCFDLIGFSSDEAHRAKFLVRDGITTRYPLLEYEIDREGCKRIIREHGLPVPPKSGCWFCPFQRIAQWKKLRKDYPELFCRANQLEERNRERRRAEGREPSFLASRPLSQIVNESQDALWEEYQYPPCRCEL
jgi:hypothetical protein